MSQAQASGLHRIARLETDLGSDVLLLSRLSGQEELGRLFEYTVDAVSERSVIAPDSILGTNVTLGLDTDVQGTQRYLNGFVTRFSTLGEVRSHAFKSQVAYGYRLVVHPWLWFATRRTDCRIFNDLSVPEIVKQVLSMYGGVIDDKLSGEHDPLKYCVQYRESDFDFVSRLMEQEGIYYYFIHENGKHRLALADSTSAHTAHPSFGTVAFRSPQRAETSGYDYVSEWASVAQVQSGKYLYKDYDFFKARVIEGAAANSGSHTYGDLEVYDYHGRGVDIAGDKEIKHRTAGYASIRMDALRSRYRTWNGEGNMRGLQVGYRFKLSDHPDKAANAEYVAVSTRIEATVNQYGTAAGGGGAEFKIGFGALKADQVYRSECLTSKPVIQGAQTAIVVGNGEIDTDEFGRVQLQFHWDRIGGTCWARVAQSIAGNKWGAFFIPRIGHEVIVEFLEGDPDHPIVTGVVYSGMAKPPYALPGEKTKSTIKTNSSEGGGGFNELRFEDKKGKEQIFVHGERQLDVRIKEDRLSWIGQDSHLIVKRDRKELVDQDQHLQVKGDLNEAVSGTHSLKIDQSLQYKVAQKSALDSGQEIHLKAGMKIVLEAGVQISLKVGGNFINISPAGVEIQGVLTKINCGGSAGSGSGSSPAAPQDPKEADNGEPGVKDDPPPPPAPPAVKTYSPQAVALQQAAQTGAPFCEL